MVDVKFVDTRKGTRMIVDSGAPLSLVSLSWLKRYQEEKQVGNSEMKYRNCVQRFRLGKTIYKHKRGGISDCSQGGR